MSEANSPGPRRGRPGRARPGAGQVVGELLLTAGALILLFVIYEAFWTNIVSGRLQDGVNSRLEESWAQHPGAAGDEPIAPPAPMLGDGFARVHLPAIGAVNAVVEGVRNEDLRAGPGHYPDSQMPGAPGNFGLAGHRIGSGAVFQRLDQLTVCDSVVVETEFEWMTYRILPLETAAPGRRAAAAACLSPAQVERVAVGDYAHLLGQHITVPGDIAVVNPLPGAEWVPPGPELESVLTLTTCHPLFSNSERMIVHAILVETIPKSAGTVPAALEEK